MLILLLLLVLVSLKMIINHYSLMTSCLACNKRVAKLSTTCPHCGRLHPGKIPVLTLILDSLKKSDDEQK